MVHPHAMYEDHKISEDILFTRFIQYAPNDPWHPLKPVLFVL